MSDLRNQLDRLRDDYRSQRYPGDLASELLAPPARKISALWVIAGATAITALAASLAIYVGVIPTTHHGGGGGGEVAISDVAPIELGPMPEFPSNVSVIPAAQPVSELGSMPAIPSIDLSFNLPAAEQQDNPEEVS